MQFSLRSLVLVVTISCLFLALMTYGPVVFILLGACLALTIWELIQFGRELNRH